MNLLLQVYTSKLFIYQMVQRKSPISLLGGNLPLHTPILRLLNSKPSLFKLDSYTVQKNQILKTEKKKKEFIYNLEKKEVFIYVYKRRLLQNQQFSMFVVNRKSNSGLKLQQERPSWKYFLMYERMESSGKDCLGEVVESLLLDVFKNRLVKHLSEWHRYSWSCLGEGTIV